MARRLARDTVRFEHRAVAAAAGAGFRAMQKAVAAWRAGRRWEVPGEAASQIMRAREELRDAMVLGYLLGLKRAQRSAALSLSASSSAVTILRRQLDLSERDVAAIRDQYDAEAFRVLANASASLDRSIQKAMIQAVGEGMHVREGVKELAKAFDAEGITPKSSFQLEAIFRTQMSTAYSAARWHALQAPEVQRALWGFRYATVGDDRVRPAHQLLEGVTLPKDDAFWDRNWPPNGWACRCAALELFEERDVVAPPEGPVELQGRLITPGADKGFGFNPGKVFEAIGALPEVPGVPTPGRPDWLTDEMIEAVKQVTRQTQGSGQTPPWLTKELIRAIEQAQKRESPRTRRRSP
jgi:SPP1 gp7 family putative phage head morphogenesis protein